MFGFARRRRARRPSDDTARSDGGSPRGHTAREPDDHAQQREPHPFDREDVWERQMQLDLWRQEQEYWGGRMGMAPRSTVHRSPHRGTLAPAVAECAVARDDADYAYGFLADEGLLPRDEFDRLVPPEARYVMLVGEARTPVAFHVIEVADSIDRVGLFRSGAVVCRMDGDLQRVQRQARVARQRDSMRYLFQEPHVEIVPDAFGVPSLVYEAETWDTFDRRWRTMPRPL